MPTKTPYWLTDDGIAVALAKARQERTLLLQECIEVRIKGGELENKDLQAKLNAFHSMCDQWAIDGKTAKAILFTESRDGESVAAVLERISYSTRIYRLVDEVVQGDELRKQRWIRRSNLALEGQRPIDLMTSGSEGIAIVVEYLEFCRIGHSF